MPKTFKQATPPLTGHGVGDFWYDTDDDITSMCVIANGTLQWIGI